MVLYYIVNSAANTLRENIPFAFTKQVSINPFNEKKSAAIFAALKENYVQYKNKNKGAFGG